MLFLHLLSDHMIFILDFVNVVYHIDWFVDDKPSSHHWKKPQLVIALILLIIVEFSFVQNFLLYIHQRILTYNFLFLWCSCLVSVSANAGLSEHVQKYFSSSIVSVQLRPTLREPRDCSAAGLPVHCQLLEFTQTHVHWVRDAIQPSHLLSSPSPPTFNLSQHWGLFKWISSLHQVAKVLFLAIFFRKDSTLKFSIICLSVFFFLIDFF